MLPTINLILLVTPGRIIDKRRDGWSSMLYLKKWTSEANVKANTKFCTFCFVAVVNVYVKKVPSKLLHCYTSITHSFTVDFTLYFSATGCQICWEIGNYVTNRPITIRKLRTSKRSCNFYSARTGFRTSRQEEYVVFFCLCAKRVNPVLLSLPGKASRCYFFHRYVIFNNKWNNHFFGFDFKGYKPMPNEAFPRIASTLGHTTGKGCTRAWIYLCNGYFIDCLFVVSDFFHMCIMSDQFTRFIQECLFGYSKC